MTKLHGSSLNLITGNQANRGGTSVWAVPMRTAESIGPIPRASMSDADPVLDQGRTMDMAEKKTRFTLKRMISASVLGPVGLLGLSVLPAGSVVADHDEAPETIRLTGIVRDFKEWQGLTERRVDAALPTHRVPQRFR